MVYQCKKFKHVVLRCSHHLQVQSPPRGHGVRPHVLGAKGTRPSALCMRAGHETLCAGCKGHKASCPGHEGPEGSLNWFFVPHCLSVQKVQTTPIMTSSVEMSPPPASTIPTPFTFTEWQKAYVGPHHQSKIIGEKNSQ